MGSKARPYRVEMRRPLGCYECVSTFSTEDAARRAVHGLFFWRPWQSRARVVFGGDVIAKYARNGYEVDDE